MIFGHKLWRSVELGQNVNKKAKKPLEMKLKKEDAGFKKMMCANAVDVEGERRE